MTAYRKNPGNDSYDMDRRILRSLNLPMIQRLSFSKYKHPIPTEGNECPVFSTLSSTIILRTLVLAKCNNIPFILALNPTENPSKLLLCPNLEEFVLYIKSRDQFHTKHLISMAKNRASRGAKLSSITVFGLGELAPGNEVLKLREHVKRVEYKIDKELPDWDDLLGEWC
jgi:hypothetical protein